jgi:hypothetical protein
MTVSGDYSYIMEKKGADSSFPEKPQQLQERRDVLGAGGNFAYIVSGKETYIALSIDHAKELTSPSYYELIS